MDLQQSLATYLYFSSFTLSTAIVVNYYTSVCRYPVMKKIKFQMFAGQLQFCNEDSIVFHMELYLYGAIMYKVLPWPYTILQPGFHFRLTI